MTAKNQNSISHEVSQLLAEQRLHDTFVKLKNITQSRSLFDLYYRISKLEETYAYMLRYLADGVKDPSRESLLSDIVDELYRITDEIVIDQNETDTPTLFYNIKRYNATSGTTLSQLLAQFKKTVENRNSLETFFKKNGNESELNDLFNSLWTSFPVTKGESETITDLLNELSVTADEKVTLLFALTLGSLEFFDKEKMDILLDTYAKNANIESEESDKLASAALIGIIFNLLKYRERRLPRSTKNRFDLLRDIPSWTSDFDTTLLEIVRVRDTARINKTMREEIIPGMMALRPEIEKKLKDGDFPLEDMDALQENPEWDELLEKSGIKDKMKELNEIQMEGGDVFMSTFSNLKNFPFFHNVYSWFIPFSTDANVIDKIISKNPEFLEVAALIENLPFLCDSDKYSMILSVDMVPENQRKLMLSQIVSQRDQMVDFTNSLINETKPAIRKRRVRNYLQNIYRFYNLFRRKSEFYNAFEDISNVIYVRSLKEDIQRPTLLNLLGEFYFKHNYWEDAINTFTVLDQMNEFSGAIYQKMGYCYERLGEFKKAVEAYEQAELLDNASEWVKKRLAQTYRRVGRLNDAIRTFLSLIQTHPDNTELALSLGYTYIQADKFKEAIKQFYKVEFLDSDSRKALRPLAWSLFMTRDFNKAKQYYTKILLDHPTSEDYLNMGHVALALGEFKDSINYYKLSVLNGGGTPESFFKSLETDRKALESVGIESSTVSLLADAMLYTLNS